MPAATGVHTRARRHVPKPPNFVCLPKKPTVIQARKYKNTAADKKNMVLTFFG